MLIHAGASGVGTAAVQLVKLAGATSYVTAGSQEKINFVKSIGAQEGFNYKEGDWAEKVQEATDGKLGDWAEKVQEATDGKLTRWRFLYVFKVLFSGAPAVQFNGPPS